MAYKPVGEKLLHHEKVLGEWIDYNGHMNVAYYVLAFDLATEALLEAIDLGEAARDESGFSTFAVEAHVTYQREVMQGDPLVFETEILAHDEKRLHYFQEMRHAGEGFLSATAEWILLSIDLKTRKVAPFAPPTQKAIAALYARQKTLPFPKEAGRRMELGKGMRRYPWV